MEERRRDYELRHGKIEEAEDKEEEKVDDVIDRLIPSERDQADYNRGLVRALRVVAEHLPPGAVTKIRLRLNEVRGEYEGPADPPDKVAGLAIGMVDYCLCEATTEDRDDEER